MAKLLSVATPVASLTSPVIAAINGDALGQGLELALACDLRVAAETARFALPHIVSGLIPWDGGTQRLPRIVGKAKAMEMILTGESLDAIDAYKIGLVNKVVPPEGLLQTVKNMGQAMASKASLALKYAKEAIHEGLDLTLEQGLRLEADLYFLLQTTEDRTEGVRAFLEKRHPQFKGR
jgi:enoyl-CoA hydratase/carnithine racemase